MKKTYNQLREEFFKEGEEGFFKLSKNVVLKFEGDLVQDKEGNDVKRGDINVEFQGELVAWYAARNETPSVFPEKRVMADAAIAEINGEETAKPDEKANVEQANVENCSYLKKDLELAEAAYLAEQLKTARLEGAISVYERLIPAGFNSLNKTN